jgi:(S)-ureidoglycine aminohydrolase
MNHFGHTRTSIKRNHAFIAPDGHVKTTLPGWLKTQGIILISPQMGSRFTQYLALMDAGAEGAMPLPGVERFMFVIDGSVNITTGASTITLERSDYIYLPPDEGHTIRTVKQASLNIFERRYIPLGTDTERPPIVTGNEQKQKGEIFLGDSDVIAKKLLPDLPTFDMAVNTMNFRPGATLPFAETHFMEHGMLMLRGGGIYRLGDDWYPIQAGDVLWMGPYCPQWFGALGKEGSTYLLYKEANRDVFMFERES